MEEEAKKLLLDTLDFYKYKLDKNLCTPKEIASLSKMLSENLEIEGTIEEFADFYNVSQVNVRATINRKLMAKPKRKVLYPFHEFVKVIPKKWRKQ